MGSIAGLFRLFLQPFIPVHPPSPGALNGKTILITGANTGLGLETARHCVNFGAERLVLGVRSSEKGRKAKQDIEESTNRSIVIDVWEVDLERFDSVKKFSEKAIAELPRLDIAIMNAGLASHAWHTTPDGWERMLQVNVLSTALMSRMLLPKLLDTKRKYPESTPHLTIINSEIHRDAVFPEKNEVHILSALQDHSKWESTKADRYPVSKLFATYIGIELAALVPTVDNSDTPAVVVNCVAPGFCMSDLLTREKPPLVLVIIQYLTARTSEKGALTYLDGITKGPVSHGKWLENQRITKPGHYVVSEEGIRLRAKVWNEILEILQDTYPDIRSPLV